MKSARLAPLVGLLLGPIAVASAAHDLPGLGTPLLSGSASYVTGSNSATVDYAVFAPGDFTGTDPSGGAEYVYAYQFFVNVGSNPLYLATIAVDDPDAANQAALGTTSGVAPGLLSLDPVGTKSFVSLFNPTVVTAGSNSQVVLFTSPNPPTYGTTSVTFVAAPAVVSATLIPTPLPEPATMVLLAMGGLLIRRRRR